MPGTMIAPEGRLRRMVFGPAEGVDETWSVMRFAGALRVVSMCSRMILDVVRLPCSVAGRSTTRVVLFFETGGRGASTIVSALAISVERTDGAPVFDFWEGSDSESESTNRVVLFFAASSRMDCCCFTNVTRVGGLSDFGVDDGVSSWI